MPQRQVVADDTITAASARLAEKLAMRSAANVSQQFRRVERKKALAAMPQALKGFLEETDARKN